MSTARLFAILALLNVIWAPTNMMISVMQGSMSPTAVVALRWPLLALCMWALLFIPQTKRLLKPTFPSTGDATRAVLIGFFCVSASYMLYSYALTKTTSIEANVLASSYPVVMGLFAYLFLKEHVGPRRWLAIAIGLIGAYIVSFGWQWPNLSQENSVGNGLFVLGLILECTALTMATKIVLRSSGLGTLAFEATGAALGCVIWPLIIKGPLALRIDAFGPSSVIYTIYLVLIGGAFAFGAWYVLVEKAPVSLMMLSTLIQPPIAAFLGYMFLHEKVTQNTIIGSIAIVVGLIVAATEKNLGVAGREMPGYEAG